MPANYEQLRLELPGMKPYRITSWGKSASNEDIERAVRGLITSTDPEEQRCHLWIFRERIFPSDPELLMQFANSEDRRTSFAAIRSLSQLTHPSVRTLAFRLMENHARWRGRAVSLLARNFDYGDHEIVLNWFEREEDRDTLHAFESDLLDFWKEHKHEKTEVRMLNNLYEKGPCSFCRESAVRRLIELNALSEPSRAECRFDSNDEIRDLVGVTG